MATLTSDGKVDAADYVVWRKTDGNAARATTIGGPISAAPRAAAPRLDSAAVPEPSAFVLLAAAVAAFGCLRRR